MAKGKGKGPHPRQEPRIPLPVSVEGLEQTFSGCVDFIKRQVCLGGNPDRPVTICYILGMAHTERFNDYVLRPLAQDEMLASMPMEQVSHRLAKGGLYTLAADWEDSMDKVAVALVAGACALFCPEKAGALVIPIPTEEKRSVGQPENEPALKGSRESFVETVRTNTAMVRRYLKAPELKIKEQMVGRQSLTLVDVVYLEGIADPVTVERLENQLQGIDIDGVEATGNLEEYLAGDIKSPFPRLAYTQRPDRFCQGLLDGRVGLFADGIPLGWLVPGTIDQFFQTSQDRAYHWLAASALRLLRYGCALVTLLLPGLYIALVTFHPEAIPVKLALSIVAAKQEVPFSTVFEVLTMLLAFEVIQEAGLRLPGPVGSAVSILGGLVVGSAAVEARIVSPAVLVAVATAGIAGYTQPSQDFGNALRLWRFLLTVLASIGGLFGLVLGFAALFYHLACLESFGVPYLAPFTTEKVRKKGGPSLVRLPLPLLKWRDGAVNTDNRRNQQ